MKLINLCSIRTKVILFSLTILCLTIGALSVMYGYLFARDYATLLNSNAYVTGQNLRIQLDRLLNLGLNVNTISDFNRYCAAVPANYHDLAYAFVTDSGGKVVFFSNPEQASRDLDIDRLYNKVAEPEYSLNQYDSPSQSYNEVILPVKAGQGEFQAFIGIGYAHNLLRKKLQPVFVSTGIIALISFLLSFSSLIFTLSLWITRPLTRLLKVIQEIRQEDLADKQVKINSRDEIGQLAATFNKMVQELHYNRKILIEKKRIEKEMEIARMIQTSLLPDFKKSDHPGFDISATMLPTTEVGGDYYDVIPDKQGRIWLGIGDVTGHGVLSGLIMMMLQTSTYTCIHKDPEITPAELVNITNKVLYENIRNRLCIQRFMTLAFLRGDSAGNFVFSGKHLPVIIYRRELRECEMIDIKGFWAGVLPDISSKTVTAEFRLNRGDVLFLYSDGLTEAINGMRTLYGYENFIHSINKNCLDSSLNAEGILRGIMNDLFDYMETQRDDISLMVVRKK